MTEHGLVQLQRPCTWRAHRNQSQLSESVIRKCITCSFYLTEVVVTHVVIDDEAENEIQEKFLLRNGADEVVYPEKQMALRLATKYASEQILDFIQFDGGYSIYEMAVPADWMGKTLPQLDVRRKFDVNIISLRRDGQVTVPRADDVFQQGDVVYAVGEMKKLYKCFHVH